MASSSRTSLPALSPWPSTRGSAVVMAGNDAAAADTCAPVANHRMVVPAYGTTEGVNRSLRNAPALVPHLTPLRLNHTVPSAWYHIRYPSEVHEYPLWNNAGHVLAKVVILAKNSTENDPFNRSGAASFTVMAPVDPS